MKKIIFAILLFAFCSTPCYSAETASLFGLDGTLWDVGSGLGIGFYQRTVWLCDYDYCIGVPGFYGRVAFDAGGCDYTGSCVSVGGFAFPFWGIGIMQACIDYDCASGLMIKVSDSFGVVPFALRSAPQPPDSKASITGDAVNIVTGIKEALER